MTENTKLWDILGRTDPKHTKPFTRVGGFKGTAIKPMWSYRRMTEEFGPCGKGWGVGKPDFQVVDGPDGERLVFCTASIWWIEADVPGEDGVNPRPRPINTVYGVGGDKAVGKNKYGFQTDDEAFKKAYTDALTNALKMIGVGADVHMGLFDDSKYVNSMKQEFAESDSAQGFAENPAPAPEDPKLRDGLKIYKQTGRTSSSSLKQDKSPDNWGAFEQELAEVKTVAGLTKFAMAWSAISERDIWPTSWHNLAKAKINDRREELINGTVPDDDVFPGDREASLTEG